MKFEDKPPSSSVSPRNLLNKKRNTFVGTAEYVSPEVLKDEEAGMESDLWALGCIIYQMFTGTTPFKDKTEYLVFKKILEREITFPNDFSEVAQDLVKSLLMINPLERIGSGPEGKIIFK
jgi:3-phosphoinositide dependent protein kinase-1